MSMQYNTTSNYYKLISLEQLVIISYILDLDLQGFAPRLEL